NPRFRRGIVAQFLYVGMQVAVWSFTIRLALELGDINVDWPPESPDNQYHLNK
ncbi:TPA: hypothetical protein RHZ68_004736, partial [Escherichia coli]|nr:hypothetical protein [Escherichia coli]